MCASGYLGDLRYPCHPRYLASCEQALIKLYTVHNFVVQDATPSPPTFFNVTFTSNKGIIVQPPTTEVKGLNCSIKHLITYAWGEFGKFSPVGSFPHKTLTGWVSINSYRNMYACKVL